MKAILILSAFASAVASFVLGILYSNGGLRLRIPIASTPPPVSSPSAPQAPSPPAAPAGTVQEQPPLQAAPEPSRSGEPISAAPWTEPSRRDPRASTAPWRDRSRPLGAEEVVLRVANESGQPVSVEIDRACDEIALVTASGACLPVLRGCDVRAFRVHAGEYRITLDGRPQGERIAFDPRREYVLEFVPCGESAGGTMARLVEDGRVVFQTMLGGVPHHADAPPTDAIGVGFGR